MKLGAADISKVYLGSTEVSKAYLGDTLVHGSTNRNPYVTDGLLAMWDGEWNAGFGVHDANATTWLELVNNIASGTIPATSSFASDHLIKGSDAIDLITDASSLFSGVTAVTLEVYSGLSVAGALNAHMNSIRVAPLSLFYGGFRSVNNTTGFQGPMIYIDRNTYVGMKNGTTWDKKTTFANATKTFVVSNLSATNRTWACYYNTTQLSSKYNTYTSTISYDNDISIRGGSTGQAEIYSIRIYGKELSAAEIASNHNVDLQRFSNT